VIGVVDYVAGNAASVVNALKRFGEPYRLVAAPEHLEGVDHIVLPGVGRAGPTMRSLADNGLVDALTDAVMRDRVLFLGICIGVQLLFEHSEEDDQELFGWLDGEVKRIGAERGRVPHIGWNEVIASSGHPFVDPLHERRDWFYFVNSYCADPADRRVLAAETDYGGPMCAAVASGNIFGTQFHVEKSGRAGLALLDHFVHLDDAGLGC
jgi:imidazole glycerol-phosphate synthase subunit HisH